LVDKSIIPHLKSCCISLGLTKKGDSQPISVNGTGFLIDSDGYFVTADHVFDSIKNSKNRFKKEGLETEYRGFVYQTGKTSGQLVSIKIEHGRSVHMDIPEISEHIPYRQDLLIGRLSGKNNFPFLKFDKTKIQIFDEVFVCGYPGGRNSLRPNEPMYGDSLSPILQYGRVSNLLPSDESQIPYGIQTDIIGVGGSSGSPIVDANTEQVLGIVQRGINSEVQSDRKIDSANAGLVWGLSNYFFSDPIKQMVKFFKSEFDDQGRPLSSEKIPHNVELTDTFYPENMDESSAHHNE